MTVLVGVDVGASAALAVELTGVLLTDGPEEEGEQCNCTRN
jgi:hypothetical protein